MLCHTSLWGRNRYRIWPTGPRPTWGRRRRCTFHCPRRFCSSQDNPKKQKHTGIYNDLPRFPNQKLGFKGDITTQNGELITKYMTLNRLVQGEFAGNQCCGLCTNIIKHWLNQSKHQFSSNSCWIETHIFFWRSKPWSPLKKVGIYGCLFNLFPPKLWYVILWIEEMSTCW